MSHPKIGRDDQNIEIVGYEIVVEREAVGGRRVIDSDEAVGAAFENLLSQAVELAGIKDDCFDEGYTTGSPSPNRRPVSRR